MASHFFLARLRNFPGEAGHQTNASAARFRGELIRGVQDRWTLSRAGLSLSKSLSVRRVISRNPFCAVLSRSSLPKKGRRENEKPTKTMQLFNRARFLPLSLSRASFRYCFFIFSVLQAIGTLFLLALSRSRWSRVCAIDWHGNSISLWKLDELRV